MKSRLLPQSDEAREPQEAARVPQRGRRESDMLETLDDATTKLEEAESSDPLIAKQQATVRSSPEVSARPQGRLVVASILLVCVLSIGYSLWSTFLRTAAFGIVAGKVTEISPPWSGTLTAIHVTPGDRVSAGEMLATVADPDLVADIERLDDQLRIAQAEVKSHAAQLALDARQRSNEAEAIRARYFDLRGELATDEARYEELTSKLHRREELASQQAYSDEEIESLRFVQQGLVAKMRNSRQAIEAVERQIAALPDVEDHATQLQPATAKIDHLQAEIARLRARQQRGTIRAPMAGTVIEVTQRVGERVASDQPLVALLPRDGVELVLYVEESTVGDYPVGKQVEISVEATTQRIICRVERIGSRMERLPEQIARVSKTGTLLLPIYLKPVDASALSGKLRLGSVIRQPSQLFGGQD